MSNLEVMRQLRRVVENAPDELLHMRAIVEHTDCGTARCALGWAIIDPWFQQNTRINEVMPADYQGKNLRMYGNQSAGHTSDILFDVFGLPADQFRDLFGCNLSTCFTPAHGVSKQEVLDNIDRVLNGEPPIPYEARKDWCLPPLSGRVRG